MLLSSRTKDITNQRFGSLVAMKPHHKDHKNNLYWEYQCDCGNTHIARGNTITNQAKRNIPEVPSCGCVELRNKTKHGFRKLKNTHPAYRAYRGIMSRCYDPNNTEYKWYGGKGVTICAEWKNNPKAFVEWAIDNGWKKGLHIDKDILCIQLNITPHKYSPNTCQWVSAKTNVGFATNRDNYGRHPNIKLSHQEVKELLEIYNSGKITNKSELARKYNLKSPSSVSKIIRKALQGTE